MELGLMLFSLAWNSECLRNDKRLLRVFMQYKQIGVHFRVGTKNPY
jgi:hypothetical protein